MILFYNIRVKIFSKEKNMKKKILMFSLMVVMLVFVFALCASATTYNYYENEVAEDNKLLTIEASFGAKNTRFELISKMEGDGFAKTDNNGKALTWYIINDDYGTSVRNIVVKSTPTVGGDVGTTDENGNYTYGVDADGVSFSKKVVSVNFFGEEVKTLPEQAYMATYSLHTPGQLYQYCQVADGSYLLALYLPDSLTSIPKQLCFRAPIVTLEFENNTVLYENFGAGVTGFDPNNKNETAYAFSFCANLKSLTIPEGIKSIQPHTFRESLSLSYIKLPSTMERLENDVFFHAIGFETVVFGKNMKFIGYLNSDYTKVYNDWGIKNFNIKYMYVPKTVNTSNSSFDTYRGYEKTYLNVDRSLVFFFAGTLEEARVVAEYSRDRHFKSAVNGVTSAKNSTTPGEAPVSYDVYIQNKSYYDNLNKDRHVLVYNVPNCVAFGNGGHNLVKGAGYTSLLESGFVGEYCTDCDYEKIEAELAPLFTFKGYSAKIDGDKICVSYDINTKAVEKYKELFGEFSYGLVFAVADSEDKTTLELVNSDYTTKIDKAVAVELNQEYLACDFVVKDFDWEKAQCDMQIALCLVSVIDGNVDYFCYNEGGVFGQYEEATTFTLNEIADTLAEKYTVTYACDSKMGTLEGLTLQVVSEGRTAKAVTAKANDGYTFICWSDGSKNPTIEVSPEKDMNLVAYFSPNSTGLPVMSINTEGGVDILTKEYYINCNITLFDTETGKSFANEIAEIKGRGNSTWEKFDKKPYKFKFDSKQNLFGLGKEKTWVLLADARDYSLLRNMLALDAGLTMSELEFTSEGQSVELYVNGQYRGVYYLCEQIQIKSNRVAVAEEDKKNPDQNPNTLGYLVEMDAWVAEGLGKLNSPSTIPERGITSEEDIFFKVTDGLKYGYVVKDPEDAFFKADGTLDVDGAYLTYIQTYMQTCFDTIKDKSWDEVCTLINVKSFAQAYIIFEWFKNPDTNYSSVYFYKDADILNEDGTYAYSKLNCGPLWDFDMAVGNVSHKGNGVFSKTTTLWTSQNNPWFKNLLAHDEFKVLVAEELLANESALRASVQATIDYALAHQEAYEKNFTKWNVIGTNSWSVPSVIQNIKTWEGNLDYIETYLDESLDYLIEYYGQYLPDAE